MDTFRKMPESICFSCANASPRLCMWIGGGDKSCIIEYKSRVVRSNSRHREIVSVQKCLYYEKGALKSRQKAESIL